MKKFILIIYMILVAYLSMSLLWKPEKNFLYHSGFRRYSRSSVLFKFKNIEVDAKFIIKGDKCDLFIPDLSLKEIPIKKVKFKRIIKKELLPPSQGYRIKYVRTKHYLYLVLLKFTAQQDLKRQINEWFDNHSFLPVVHSDDSESYGEYTVRRLK